MSRETLSDDPIVQDRIDEAIYRIVRVQARLGAHLVLDGVDRFPTEKRLLSEARALLNPEVRLA